MGRYRTTAKGRNRSSAKFEHVIFCVEVLKSEVIAFHGREPAANCSILAQSGVWLFKVTPTGVLGRRAGWTRVPEFSFSLLRAFEWQAPRPRPAFPLFRSRCVDSQASGCHK